MAVYRSCQASESLGERESGQIARFEAKMLGLGGRVCTVPVRLD